MASTHTTGSFSARLMLGFSNSIPCAASSATACSFSSKRYVGSL